MKFYRIRKNWAWGSSQWEYHFENDLDSDEIAEDVHAENSYSDKYRGCDIERDVVPPKDWLEKELDRSKSNAIFYEKRAQELETFISNLPE